MKHPENDARYRGLTVNKGIDQPPIINPYSKKRSPRKQYSVEEYVQGILDGNNVILSQAVTLIESLRPDHQETAHEIIER
ncbi:MAG TPA: methylmalonyl Co-A mutase-associated GTPase MeaB, partial [Bacteroidales bacterium]|nr:methylmalonyl Co-A mutase-associated GTPase MeaB [Bacteroidales bacterium]